VRVVFAGGGTGGHVYLGISLARELLRRGPAHEFLFIGTARGLESKIVPGEGFRLECITSRGLKRVGALDFVRNLLLVPGSLLQSRRLLAGFAPRVVVGVGGYSSGPVVLAAWWIGIPTMIVEPNAYPGLTNRWLARVVDHAAVAMPEAAGSFRGRVSVTGIPVRREFLEIPRRARNGAGFEVLIYGGSQGSHALNTIVCAALADLKRLGPRLHLTHQTGEREFDAVRSAYEEAGIRADVRPFLPRIYEEFAGADLIIARAGAGTVAEITAAGRAAILVPFPGAADDHQTRNAQALDRAGAARMVREPEWKPGRLAAEVGRFMEHPEELARMQEASGKLAKPDAAVQIADLIESLAGRKGGQPEHRVSDH
jgi:UDP-N-acetylglucosamine--N-acetylmuramyl-(pentapeptide) pyrophosphoryl-undecaprenol N-acetylglucosamine transferase